MTQRIVDLTLFGAMALCAFAFALYIWRDRRRASRP